MCWIIPLIVGILSALIGYLIGKQSTAKQAVSQLSEDNQRLTEQLENSQKEQQQSAIEIAALTAAKQKNHEAYQHLAQQHTALQNNWQHLQQQQAEHDKATQQQNVKIHSLQAENQRLNQSLSTCRQQLDSKPYQRINTPALDMFANAVVTPAFNAEAAKSVFGKTIKADDLTLVEGIGPKIAQLFLADGITTWQALGEMSVEQCKTLLEKAGDRFSMHNPGTWPRQAQLAANNEWQALFDWQQQLDGGREIS